ncbi:hypothetical protein [Geodermatophilus marinus]|uniref:hypothetical protein n=1 Tax=Geodermatophilus sp. LHW52908 TaxID=2303986 RepID=UPI0018F33247|nr:hypothetical protein [Geodermatophilus sp. LHW52908]
MTGEDRVPGDPRDDAGDEAGGDPACWLARVCPDCGRVADRDPPTRCAGCGRPLLPA